MFYIALKYCLRWRQTRPYIIDAHYNGHIWNDVVARAVLLLFFFFFFVCLALLCAWTHWSFHDLVSIISGYGRVVHGQWNSFPLSILNWFANISRVSLVIIMAILPHSLLWRMDSNVTNSFNSKKENARSSMSRSISAIHSCTQGRAMRRYPCARIPYNHKTPTTSYPRD